MRIIEALACGAIPILIDDFSEPFGIPWSEVGLVFDTKKHSWQYIYDECFKLSRDRDRLEQMQKKGHDYFLNVINGDAIISGNNKMYKDINTVCYGFSHKIIEKLEKIHQENH